MGEKGLAAVSGGGQEERRFPGTREWIQKETTESCGDHAKGIRKMFGVCDCRGKPVENVDECLLTVGS